MDQLQCIKSGSSGSSSRANEIHAGERDSKRVMFAESHGQKRQGEGVEELEPSADEEHLDADVEVRATKLAG